MRHSIRVPAKFHTSNQAAFLPPSRLPSDNPFLALWLTWNHIPDRPALAESRMKNTALKSDVSTRWGRRLALNYEVELRAVNGDWQAGCLQNVSLSGGLVRTFAALRPYTAVTVLIPGIPEPIAGHVARDADGALGIEWDEPAPHVVTFLRTSGAVEASPPRRTVTGGRTVGLNWHQLARGARHMFLRHRH